MSRSSRRSRATASRSASTCASSRSPASRYAAVDVFRRAMARSRSAFSSVSAPTSGAANGSGSSVEPPSPPRFFPPDFFFLPAIDASANAKGAWRPEGRGGRMRVVVPKAGRLGRAWKTPACASTSSSTTRFFSFIHSPGRRDGGSSPPAQHVAPHPPLAPNARVSRRTRTSAHDLPSRPRTMAATANSATATPARRLYSATAPSRGAPKRVAAARARKVRAARTFRAAPPFPQRLDRALARLPPPPPEPARDRSAPFPPAPRPRAPTPRARSKGKGLGFDDAAIRPEMHSRRATLSELRSTSPLATRPISAPRSSRSIPAPPVLIRLRPDLL